MVAFSKLNFADRIYERSLLDDLEEYINSSERSRIRSITVESTE